MGQHKKVTEHYEMLLKHGSFPKRIHGRYGEENWDERYNEDLRRGAKLLEVCKGYLHSAPRIRSMGARDRLTFICQLYDLTPRKAKNLLKKLNKKKKSLGLESIQIRRAVTITRKVYTYV